MLITASNKYTYIGSRYIEREEDELKQLEAKIQHHQGIFDELKQLEAKIQHHQGIFDELFAENMTINKVKTQEEIEKMKEDYNKRVLRLPKLKTALEKIRTKVLGETLAAEKKTNYQ
jgi:hypothetical protein